MLTELEVVVENYDPNIADPKLENEQTLKDIMDNIKHDNGKTMFNYKYDSYEDDNDEKCRLGKIICQNRAKSK